MISEKKIIKLITEKLRGTDVFLIDINIGSGNNIHVSLDGDSGVRIEDCKAISRYIESNLDREVADFSLEVSSAGLDRPLQILRQYKNNIGRGLKIKTNEGEIIKGTLKNVTEEGVLLEKKEKQKKKQKKDGEAETIALSFDIIKEAKIELSFN